MIITKKSDTQDKYKTRGILKHHQPIYRHPFGSACFPETKTDAHGAGKQQYNIPGDFLQIALIKNLCKKEYYG
jgi:hypothetical protein